MSKQALVFQQYYCKLVEILPMNDSTFIAELVPHDLLPGDLKHQLKAQNTPKDKATHFLDNVIKPSVTSGVGNSFDQLLVVMKNSDYKTVKELHKLITDTLRDMTADSG